MSSLPSRSHAAGNAVKRRGVAGSEGGVEVEGAGAGGMPVGQSPHAVMSSSPLPPPTATLPTVSGPGANWPPHMDTQAYGGLPPPGMVPMSMPPNMGYPHQMVYPPQAPYDHTQTSQAQPYAAPPPVQGLPPHVQVSSHSPQGSPHMGGLQQQGQGGLAGYRGDEGGGGGPHMLQQQQRQPQQMSESAPLPNQPPPFPSRGCSGPQQVVGPGQPMPPPPGMEYGMMNGMDPNGAMIARPTPGMPPQVPPPQMNGMGNGQVMHVNNAGPPSGPLSNHINVPQNLHRLLSMAGVSPQAIHFLNSAEGHGTSAALQSQLVCSSYVHAMAESQLKHAIVQGQPIQHIKLLIEDQLRLEEKKQKKRAANRRSASSSRARKKKYIEKLTTENRRLQRISRILAILPDLVLVVNEEGRITFASWRSQKMLQYPEALVGQNIFQLTAPESHPKISTAISDTMRDLAASEATGQIKPEFVEPTRSGSSSSSSSGSGTSSTSPQYKSDVPSAASHMSMSIAGANSSLNNHMSAHMGSNMHLGVGGSSSHNNNATDDVPHHSRSGGGSSTHVSASAGAEQAMSDASDDSSDGSLGSDTGDGGDGGGGGGGGGGRVISASASRQGTEALHHSSGGLNSEKQCAQRAMSSSSDEDGQLTAITTITTKDVRFDRKNQVCLLRQDGSRMWCMMRATGFQRPSIQEDRESLLEAGLSDDEETQSITSSSNVEQFYVPGSSNAPEIILSFRPVDGSDLEGLGCAAALAAQIKTASASQPSGLQAPWAQQTFAPLDSSTTTTTSQGPPAKKRILAAANGSGPQALPTAVPATNTQHRSSQQHHVAFSSGVNIGGVGVGGGGGGSTPAMSSISSGSESSGNATVEPPMPASATAYHQQPHAHTTRTHGSKRRLGSSSSASNTPVLTPSAPLPPPPPVHMVPQIHAASFYYPQHQLQHQQGPLMHQPQQLQAQAVHSMGGGGRKSAGMHHQQHQSSTTGAAAASTSLQQHAHHQPHVMYSHMQMSVSQPLLQHPHHHQQHQPHVMTNCVSSNGAEMPQLPPALLQQQVLPPPLLQVPQQVQHHDDLAPPPLTTTANIPTATTTTPAPPSPTSTSSTTATDPTHMQLQKNNHRAIELEAARSLMRIMTFSSGNGATSPVSISHTHSTDNTNTSAATSAAAAGSGVEEL